MQKEVREMQEIVKSEKEQNKALKEIIRRNETCLKQNNESLSRSDEAVAKSLSEKEDLEGKLETYQKRITKLEEDRTASEIEIADLKRQLGTAKNAYEVLTSDFEKVEASHQAELTEKEKLKWDNDVKVAAMTAEHEQQVYDVFLYK
jgi:chromosome segregation ATPase